MGYCESCEYLTTRHNCKKYNKRLAYSSYSSKSLSCSSHERCSECDKDFYIKQLEAEKGIDINMPLKAKIFDAHEDLDGTTELIVDVQVIELPHLPYTNEPEIIYNGGRSQSFEFLPQD